MPASELIVLLTSPGIIDLSLQVDRGLRMKKIESLPPISMSGLCKELEGRGSSPPWVGSGVSEMDLLQAIIFDRADSAVQRRVLGLVRASLPSHVHDAVCLYFEKCTKRFCKPFPEQQSFA